MKINHFAYCRSVSEKVFCARRQAGYRLPTDIIDKAAKAGARYHRSGDIDGMMAAIKKVFLDCEVKYERDGSVA